MYNSGGSFVAGIENDIDAVTTVRTIIENNTVYGRGNCLHCQGAGRPSNKTIRNNVFVDTSGLFSCCQFDDITDESYNNASSDDTADDAATQANNLINIIAADEFISLDPTSPNFLKPSGSGQLYNMGAQPEIPENIAGIEGNPRPWTSR